MAWHYAPQLSTKFGVSEKIVDVAVVVVAIGIASALGRVFPPKPPIRMPEIEPWRRAAMGSLLVLLFVYFFEREEVAALTAWQIEITDRIVTWSFVLTVLWLGRPVLKQFNERQR
ncbi:MAG: hypothetical protein ABUS57_19645 [Pseudomonadota bacterium]